MYFRGVVVVEKGNARRCAGGWLVVVGAVFGITGSRKVLRSVLRQVLVLAGPSWSVLSLVGARCGS